MHYQENQTVIYPIRQSTENPVRTVPSVVLPTVTIVPFDHHSFEGSFIDFPKFQVATRRLQFKVTARGTSQELEQNHARVRDEFEISDLIVDCRRLITSP